MSKSAFPSDLFNPGLTKLEYFAAQAMNGFLSDNEVIDKIITTGGSSNGFAALIAEYSFEIAEKMIERSKKVD